MYLDERADQSQSRKDNVDRTNQRRSKNKQGKLSKRKSSASKEDDHNERDQYGSNLVQCSDTDHQDEQMVIEERKQEEDNHQLVLETQTEEEDNDWLKDLTYQEVLASAWGIDTGMFEQVDDLISIPMQQEQAPEVKRSESAMEEVIERSQEDDAQ